MPTTQILLALDGSQWSSAASNVALDLQTKLKDSALTGLHVVNVVTASGNFLKDLPGRLGFEPAVVSEDVEEAAAAHGRRILGTFKVDAETAGIETRTILEHGAVAERLLHHADASDLVIMGFKGETEQRFPGQGGGTAGTIVESCPVPLLLVPPEASVVNEVAIGYDGSEGARHALSAVRRIFDGSGITVHAVFVTPTGAGAEVLDQVEEGLTGCIVRKHVILDSNVRDGMKRAVEETGADLLALGFRGMSTLKDFFFGSTSEYLALAGGTMVLIAH
ncbi:MAG: universal stress protein [Deltaproteobacteria bacterium]|nr:MAG: universal stress protein [Deltaproteobacteria bacterium]